jgi:hypothetical protein
LPDPIGAQMAQRSCSRIHSTMPCWWACSFIASA